MPAAPRTLIVSNRLPVTVRRGDDGLVVERSAGGLATGLSGLHARAESLWIGGPGDVAPDDPRAGATVDPVRDALSRDGLLRRYRADDGFGVPTVAFTRCTFWPVEALARVAAAPPWSEAL